MNHAPDDTNLTTIVTQTQHYNNNNNTANYDMALGYSSPHNTTTLVDVTTPTHSIIVTVTRIHFTAYYD